jgi:NitT/TauT family transport system permease protein
LVRERAPKARMVGRSLVHFAIRDVGAAVLAITAAAVVWALATLVVNEDWLPTPAAVWSKSTGLLADPAFRGVFVSSLKEAAIGFAIATAIGTTAGLAMGFSRWADDGLRPYLDLLLVVPPAALAPILIVIVGLSNALTILMATIFAVSVIGISTAAAAKDVDKSLMEVGLVFGARGRLRLIKTIVVPAMSPAYFTGLHLGMARAMKGMIVGQVVVGVIGIGAYEAQFQQVFDSVGVWSIAVLLVAASLFMTWLVKAADSMLNYWAYRS